MLLNLLDETFNAVAVLAMLLSKVGSLVLGIGLLRRRMLTPGAGHSNSE